MKKITLFFISLLLFISCNDDEIENTPDKDFRIKEIITNDNYKFSFTYEENKLIKIDYLNDFSSGGWEFMDRRMELKYSGNQIIHEVYDKYLGNSVELIEKYVITLQDDKIIKRERYIGSDVEPTRTHTYEYSNDKLITSLIHSTYPDSYSKDNYLYNSSNNLTDMINYHDNDGEWEETYKFSLNYDNNKVFYLTEYHIDGDEWVGWDRREFEYSDEKLTHQKFFHWNTTTNSWDFYEDIYMDFYYDGNDNLKTVDQYFNYHPENIKVDIYYEEGIGNTFDILPPQSALLGMPNEFYLHSSLYYY